LGRAIRIASGNRLLKFPDELDFPNDYTREAIASKVERQQRGKPKREEKKKSYYDKSAQGPDNEKGGAAYGKDSQTQTQVPLRRPASPRVNSYPYADFFLAPPIGSSEDLQPFGSAATLANPYAPFRSGDRLRDNPRPRPDLASRSESKSDSKSGSGEGDDSATLPDGEFASPKTAEEKTQEPENQEETKKRSPVSGDEAEKGADPNLVTWYGEDDPENP